jgi:hypothetical protein
MSRQLGEQPALRSSSDDRPRASHPGDVPVRRRLARSAWSVTTGVLVLLMLCSLAVLMVSSAPLWMWAAPGAPANNESLQNPTADGDPSFALE